MTSSYVRMVDHLISHQFSMRLGTESFSSCESVLQIADGTIHYLRGSRIRFRKDKAVLFERTSVIFAAIAEARISTSFLEFGCPSTLNVTGVGPFGELIQTFSAIMPVSMV